ncbi:uncharacterized protein LOC134820012 [Bolinopsis microptera]|uniref:uncharacterized protein LOC134820012 n=1 Tax=Bolinopsis microptera TaxID=2820187 RepID=UPI003078CBFF
MLQLLIFAAVLQLASTSHKYDQIASCHLRLHNHGKKIGKVAFYSTPGKGQEVKVAVSYPKVSDGKHGFHVHAAPVTENNCLTTGGHFNPDGVDHGAAGGPASSHHVGDFGNVDAEDGFVLTTLNFIVGQGTGTNGDKFYVEEDRFALEGENSLRGRAVVLHAGTDDLGLGGDNGSRKTGNAGSRLACCTLE